MVMPSSNPLFLCQETFYFFFWLSHSEETTQEDFSTDIYKAYEPNKSKYKSLLKTCISHQRKRTEHRKMILTHSKNKLQVTKALKETLQSDKCVSYMKYINGGNCLGRASSTYRTN